MQEAEKRNKVLYHLTYMWNPSSQVTPNFSLPSQGPRQCGAEKFVHTTNLDILYAATPSWHCMPVLPVTVVSVGASCSSIPQEGWQIVKECGPWSFPALQPSTIVKDTVPARYRPCRALICQENCSTE